MILSKRQSIEKIRPRSKNERLLNSLAKKANKGDLAAKSRVLSLIRSNPYAISIVESLTKKYATFLN